MWEVLIISSNRTTGSNENFNITIPFCSEIKLLEANLPDTFDNVFAGSFTITGTVSGLTTIMVSAGRYTASSLASALTAAMSGILAGAYSVTANDLAEFTIATVAELFTADFTNFPQIGFAGVQPQASSITGQSALDTFSPPYMFVKSNNIYGTDNGTIVPNSGITGIIHAVPLCPAGITNYRSRDDAPWVKYIGQPAFETDFNFNLYVGTTAPVLANLNGAVWSIKLLCKKNGTF